MLRFKATETMIKKIMANAYNASVPIGMGFMHFRPDIRQDDFEIGGGHVIMDYVQGRMVKTYFNRMGNDVWQTKSGEADIEYQSWARKYPTFEDLVCSVSGVEIL